MSKIFRFAKIPARFIKRSESQKTSNDNNWSYKMKKLAFNLSKFNQYGLYTNDVLDSEHPLMEEVLRRLPKNVLDARNFRMIRAMQLDALKVYLPKEKWITFEQDQEYRYLDPYLREVIEERKEIYNFGCANYHPEDWPAGLVK
ncbi:Cytochrome b-c1 complex subunit 7 [Anthophora quadrimaculata]